DLRTVSATLEKQTAGKVLQKLPKELSVPKESRCHELELTSRTTEMGSRSVPNSPTTVKPHLLLPEVPHESPICTRKLTPMPRDLHPPHLTKPIRYALFEPVNWIYDNCRDDVEFDEKVRS
ncbi:hypothetical protein NECAME_08847, partial [Necator americanus]